MVNQQAEQWSEFTKLFYMPENTFIFTLNAIEWDIGTYFILQDIGYFDPQFKQW